jgi:hypothetical protein
MTSGIDYDYYTHPVEMVYSYSNYGGDFINYIVSYKCNDCGEYGPQDKRSTDTLKSQLQLIF